MTFGTCRYCGQVVNLDYEEETQAAGRSRYCRFRKMRMLRRTA